MTLGFGAEQFRATGDPRDAAYADMLDAILALRGQDVPLPGQAAAGPPAEASLQEPTGDIFAVPAGSGPNLALARSELAVPETADQLADDMSRRLRVAERAAQVVRPRIDMIGVDLLMAPTTRGVRSVLGLDSHAKRRVNFDVGGQNVQYRLDTSYKPPRGDAATGSPHAFKSEIFSSSPRLPDIEFVLEFPNQIAKGIDVHWNDGGGLMHRLLPGDERHPLLRLVDIPSESDFGRLWVALGYEKLGIHVVHDEYGPQDRRRDFFVFDPRRPKDSAFPQYIERGSRIVPGKNALSVDEFLLVVQGCVNLMPTVERQYE